MATPCRQGKGATGLRGVGWRLSYRTSSLKPDGRPVDILHDFYLPALRRAIRYDRVAGYFRSTSLAAASQGFSAFVGRQGTMRLIVGADLDPQDVQAILAGTRERLEAMLNAELALAGSGVWPAAVRRGVELLAWMVAHGYLDLRVAFRVHAQSGKPLAMADREDGYVHMKWSVFGDAYGNRLYASGSLNESRTALTLNAENIDVHCDWHGERDRQRVDEAEQAFQTLWDDQNPSLRVLTLPEAVHQRLLQVAEGVTRPVEMDGSSAAPLDTPPPSALERLRFALLRHGPRLPGGRYVGLETAPIAPWPHQAVVARRLIDTWPYSYLLCDEVGLGKTIEAGLVIRSLYLSGLVQRVLICAPASLTRQWQREMATKFMLSFGRALGGVSPRHAYLLPVEQERGASSIYEPDLVIVSTGLVARQERRPELGAARNFDIALVDEAHYARRRNPTQGSRANPEYGHLYTAINQSLRARSRCLLLATATPMQLDLVEVADLLQLTCRVGAFQFDPGLMLYYYDTLDRLVNGQPITERDWEYLRRAVLAVRDQDPLFWAFIQQAVIDGRTRLAARQWLEQGRIARGADLQGIQRLIFAASPLSRVMLRHTRPLLDIYRQEGQLGDNLAQRHILPMPRIVFTKQERLAYDQLETYCKGLTDQVAASRGGARTQNAVGFLLSFLRLRFASSLFAIRETLARRGQRLEAALNRLGIEDASEPEEIDLADSLDEGDDDTEAVRALLRHRTPADLQWERDQLQAMLTTLSDLSGSSSKMMELLQVINRQRLPDTGRFQQTVIFTRFYDTLTDIACRLLRADSRMRIGTYSGRGGQYLEPRTGRLVAVERETIKHRFLRRQIDILVCTDAAAEGLNLQTANLLVNFDLPWNPMKVEQRIGRIDRIGQKHADIYVLNLCYVDSAEQVVYGRLVDRLAQVGAIVGTQQLALLPVTRDEFECLAAKTLSAAELEQRVHKRAMSARRRTASLEMPPLDVYRTYLRLEQQMDRKQLPVDLDIIWETLSQSAYLRALGCRVMPDQEQRLMVLANLPELPDGAAVTTSRTTFEVSAPDLEGRLHFATYGDPAFESLLEQVEAFGLPACMQRLEVEIPEVPVTVVGYAVAHLNPEGATDCRLVTSSHDLASLRLDEGAQLTEVDVEPLRHTLEAIARQAYQTIPAVPRIEALNQAAGRSQEILNYLVIQGLIQSRQRTQDADALAWREIAALETIFEDKKTNKHQYIRVQRLPSAQVQTLSHLLFDITVPNTGDNSYLDAPRALLIASLEAAYRLASGMKVKKSELLTDDFLARLNRVIKSKVAGGF
ncbi:RNA polymerase-associated protein RapA [Candidatus Entotheonellaceae bacterium PAL068K]